MSLFLHSPLTQSLTLSLLVQVTGIAWASNHKELITSHGYPKHQMTIWKLEPEMTKIAELEGHTGQPLYVTIHSMQSNWLPLLVVAKMFYTKKGVRHCSTWLAFGHLCFIKNSYRSYIAHVIESERDSCNFGQCRWNTQNLALLQENAITGSKGRRNV